MEFEPRWLLLLHQSAAADRRGDHPLYGAGTTGHRICTTAGNDCVIRPQEHTQPCTDTLRDTCRCSSIHPVSSDAVSLRNLNSLIARGVDLLPIPQKPINICVSCILEPACRSSCPACFCFKRWGTKLKVSQVTSLFSNCYTSTFIEDKMPLFPTLKSRTSSPATTFNTLGLSSQTNTRKVITMTTLWLCLSVSNKSNNTTQHSPPN